MKYEKPQRGNPHQLTIRQHVPSAACIRRFADADGLVAVRRRDTTRVFRALPEADTFVARRAWSHKVEHGIFRDVEDRFQTAIDIALAGGEVDHEGVTDYAIIWAIRDDLNYAGREPIPLTKDQEEILERKGYAFARAGGEVPAHLGHWIKIMQRYDMNRAALARTRWRIGIAPNGMKLICPDAFRSGGLGALPVNRTTALIGAHEAGPPDEMTRALVERINANVLADARTLVFGHPDDLDALVPDDWGLVP
jgi:hypothetical protein